VNKKALWVFIVLLALMASACTFQFSTTVNEDATGKFVTEFGLTTEELTQLEAFGGESFDDLCTQEEFATGAPEDVVVEQEERGDEIWCVATLSFNDLAGLEEAYREMEVQINSLSLTDDEFVYDVTFGFGSDPETDIGALAAMGVELNLVWEVLTPGRVTEHNADEVDGDLLTWNLDATAPTNMQVRSNVGGGGISTGLIIGLAVAVIVVVVAIFLLTRRKPEMPQEPQPPVA
jgi:hypothetical protein